MTKDGKGGTEGKSPLEKWIDQPGIFDEEELRRAERAIDAVTSIGARRAGLLSVLLAFKKAQALGRILERVMPLIEDVLEDRERFASLPYDLKVKYALEYMRLINQMDRREPRFDELMEVLRKAEGSLAGGVERVPLSVLEKWRHVVTEVLPALAAGKDDDTD